MLLTAILIACSAGKKPQTAKEYYLEGKKALEGGFFGISDPDLALENFGKVIELFPGSEYTPLAKLGVASAHYKRKEYIIASRAFEEFARLYPGHKKVTYALFMAAKSYAKVASSPDRDIRSLKESIRILSKLLEKYPEFREREQAEELLAKCKEKIAKRYLYIAKFYLKRGLFMSAIGRLERFEKDLKDTPQAEEALKLLKKIRGRLGDEADENKF